MLEQSLLLQLARAGSPAGGMARAVLAGVVDSQLFLPDALCDSGKEQLMNLQVGKNYLVMTVTHYFTGEVVSCDLAEVVLVKAAWIPDTGRFHTIFENGQVSECEPLPAEVRVHINLGAVVAAPEWPHSLPRAVK